MSTWRPSAQWADTPCVRLYAQGVDYWFGPGDPLGRGTAGETPAEKDDRIARAKAECATCPLRAECLERGAGEEGIWGGLTATERATVCGDKAGTLPGVRRHRRARQDLCPACRAITPTGRARLEADNDEEDTAA